MVIIKLNKEKISKELHTLRGCKKSIMETLSLEEDELITINIEYRTRIAERTELTYKTVESTLSVLKSEGFIEITKRIYTKRSKNRYSDPVNSKKYRKFARIKTVYGIGEEEYKKLLQKQNNKCAICNLEFEETIKANVDHCHSSAKIRGLLCRHCNIGLGHFKDNPNLLLSAYTYLQDNNK